MKRDVFPFMRSLRHFFHLALLVLPFLEMEAVHAASPSHWSSWSPRPEIAPAFSSGTTVNGKALKPSLASDGGGQADLNFEEQLPNKARIGLAGVIVLEFRKG